MIKSRSLKKIIKSISLTLIFLSLLSIKISASTELNNDSLKNAAGQARYVDSIFSNVDVKKDITYKKIKKIFGSRELKLDIYSPSGDKEKNRPAIIWIHGGGFTSGTKESGFEKQMAVELTKKGYVNICINYRLSEEPVRNFPNTLNNAIEDSISAFEWVAENSGKYGIDKNHIAFGGHSAGGMTVINLNYNDSYLKAAAKKNIFATVDLAGGELYTGSPDKNDPPCLIVSGTADTSVPHSTAITFSELLKKAGVVHSLYQLDGAVHNFNPQFYEVLDATTDFLYKALTNKPSNIKIRKSKQAATDKKYTARQIAFKLDGKLDEWKNSEKVKLNELKEEGIKLPGEKDFSGELMIGWNKSAPDNIYLAADITDDILQTNSKSGWWNNDSMEILFNLNENGNKDESKIIKWALSANGKTMSANAAHENTKYKIVKNGNRYIWECAINITKGKSLPYEASSFKATAGKSIGISVGYNDCENGGREEQIGWIYGAINNLSAFGKVTFN